MSNFVLEAKKRDLLKKEASKKYRKEGFIPANIYGQGENVNILIKKDAFEKITPKVSRATIIDISLEGNKTYQTLIKDYDKDHLKGNFLHVDFYELKKGKPVHVSIPLVCTGSPIGLKKFGVFETIKNTVKVECLPENLVENISVDVSNLDINQSFFVKDLVIDTKKFKVLDHEDEVIANVIPADK
ncbi:MAG: 50S ribosomal protein L25 [Spirochaetales bacterium]|nr:50S ribosomal protein L25 [Spirochaetales bacterium]